jgi:hypothetical protein
MKWKKEFIWMMTMVVVILLVITMTGCEEQKQERQYTLEDNKQIATLFILNSPTYASSGKDLQLVETRTVVECPDCYEFTFEFMASGYGSRNMLVDPIMKKHTAHILVKDGEVTRAILDDVWDELEKKRVR